MSPGGPPIRVAVNALAADARWAGIGQYVDAHSRGLAAAEPSGIFALTRREHAGDWPGLLPLVAEPTSPVWEQLHLPSLLESASVSVYHSPAFGFPIVKPCAFVCTVRGCIPRLFPDLVSPRLRDFFAQWAETRVSLADSMITVSERTKHDFVHLYGADPERCTMIYQDVPPCFRPLQDRTSVETIKRRLGLDKPYILFVGRIELRKNVPRLLETFRMLQGEEGEALASGAGWPEGRGCSGSGPRTARGGATGRRGRDGPRVR